MKTTELKELETLIKYHTKQLTNCIHDNIIYMEEYNKVVEQTDWDNDRENYHIKWRTFYDKKLKYHSKAKIKRYRILINELTLQLESIINNF